MFTIKKATALASQTDARLLSMGIKEPLLVIAEDEEEHPPELVYGTNHSDIIETSGGPQHIIAGNGDDYVSAGGGPDVVECGNGQDTLIGGGGPDSMSGGNGDDVLIGGVSADKLTGGRGADTFVYLARGDAPAHGEEDEGDGDEEGGHEDGGPTVETITDFKVGVDKIDFTAFDTLVAFSSDVPMANAIWVEQRGENAVVKVDLMNGVDGDHPAEMSIVLLGVNVGALSAADFLF